MTDPIQALIERWRRMSMDRHVPSDSRFTWRSAADELESALSAGRPHSERAWCDAADWLQHTFPKAAEIAHGVRQEARRRAADPEPVKQMLCGAPTGRYGDDGPCSLPMNHDADECLAADPSPTKARLDPEGTATGKTILTAPVEGHNGPSKWPGAASTHIDLETGKRTSLAADLGPDGAKTSEPECRCMLGGYSDECPLHGPDAAPPPDPKPEARGEAPLWRVGRKVPRNLYRGEEPIAMLATPEMAAEMVALLNRR